jgi:hypothetical protein
MLTTLVELGEDLLLVLITSEVTSPIELGDSLRSLMNGLEPLDELVLSDP